MSNETPPPVGETLRDIMSNLAAAVTVVTSRHDGRDHGLTVSAFTSVSMDPPLVLVCIDYSSNSLGAIRDAGGFTVNLLREGKGEVAMKFASRDGDKFEGVTTMPPLVDVAGSSLPEDAYGILECRTVQAVAAGDHMVFIGEVERAVRTDPGAPLMYWRRAFAALDG